MKICFNGAFLPADDPILSASNRSFKWGDGLFETMKFHNGRILLEDLHFERLYLSLRLLEITKAAGFTTEALRSQVFELCQQNSCLANARIRLAVYRTDDNQTGNVIEAIPLNADINKWHEEGLNLGLYPYARKTTDAFANIKSANYLPYVLASRFAAANSFDDVAVLNTYNLVCDTSKANLFLVSDGAIYTPALHQGCVNGVMRRVVVDEAKKLGYRVYQDEVSEDQLMQANEVFLTNAIQMIRWVKSYKEQSYTCEITKKIFDAVATTIFLQ